MGKADDIMSILEDIEDFDDEVALAEADAFLEPGKPLLNLHQLSLLIERACGQDVAADFRESQVQKDYRPKFPDKLMAFFESRTDLLSERIYEQLKDGQRNRRSGL